VFLPWLDAACRLRMGGDCKDAAKNRLPYGAATHCEVFTALERQSIRLSWEVIGRQTVGGVGMGDLPITATSFMASLQLICI
jgi:hypothetical protein